MSAAGMYRFQVTQNLGAPATRERELRALSDLIQAVKVKHALILSDENEDGLEIHGVPLEVRSTAEWLLAQQDNRQQRMNDSP
jgi:hypothetical protein